MPKNKESFIDDEADVGSSEESEEEKELRKAKRLKKGESDDEDEESEEEEEEEMSGSSASDEDESGSEEEGEKEGEGAEKGGDEGDKEESADAGAAASSGEGDEEPRRSKKRKDDDDELSEERIEKKKRKIAEYDEEIRNEAEDLLADQGPRKRLRRVAEGEEDVSSAGESSDDEMRSSVASDSELEDEGLEKPKHVPRAPREPKKKAAPAPIASQAFSAERKGKKGKGSEDDEAEDLDDTRAEDERELFDGDPMDEARDLFYNPELDQLLLEETEGVGASDDLEHDEEEKKPTLKDIYEPGVLEHKMITDVDEQIRATDIPERTQIRFPDRKPPADEENELDVEARWIVEQAFQRDPLTVFGFERSEAPDELRLSVQKAIELMRVHHLEPPFIAAYRKEYIEGLDLALVWRIADWDARWSSLVERKRNILAILHEVRRERSTAAVRGAEVARVGVDDVGVDDWDKELDDLADRLDDAMTPEEALDVHADLTLRFGEALRKVQESRGLPIARRGQFSACVRAGLGGLADLFGMSAANFAENVFHATRLNEVTECDRDPLDVAADFVRRELPSAESVLAAARQMMALRLAHQPLLRRAVRQTFYARAVVTVVPTEKGEREIDEWHVYGPFKYLDAKPLWAFRGTDQFLRIIRGERDGLLKVTIDLRDAVYVTELQQLFCGRGETETARRWDAERSEAVRMAITGHLFPLFRTEVRERLIDEARETVARNAASTLRTMVDVQPYPKPAERRRKERAGKGRKGDRDRRRHRRDSDSDRDSDDDMYGNSDDEDVRRYNDEVDRFNQDRDLGPYARVLALSLGVGDEASFGVLLGADGEVADLIKLPNFRGGGGRTGPDGAPLPPDNENARRRAQSMDLLKEFVAERKPYAIAMGVDGIDAYRMYEDLKRVFPEATDPSTDSGNPRIEIVPVSPARVFRDSARAAELYPDYPPLLRQAISLGRLLQDPLVEICGLNSGQATDVTCISLHPLQSEVSPDVLSEHLVRVLMNAVSLCGVDVNFAGAHTFYAPMLQFVSGLGPRKADVLMRAVKRMNGIIATRDDLRGVLGEHVFENAAGFLVVRLDDHQRAALGSGRSEVEILDTTRVHPESYGFARQMATDALDIEIGDWESATDREERERLRIKAEQKQAKAVVDLMRDPSRHGELDALDLAEYANAIKNDVEKGLMQGFALRHITLMDIRDELKRPYAERRPPRSRPSIEQLFVMATGENEETLCRGMLVEARVLRTSRGGVVCRLNSGLSGFIPISMLSDSRVESADERVQEGQAVKCRVVEIKFDRMSVDLSTRTSDLRDENRSFARRRDAYYGEKLENDMRLAKQNRMEQQRGKAYVKRSIVHPNFKNMTRAQAEALLETADQGDVVIRPSSLGTDHLTITWKVDEGMYQHIDVVEHDKQNALALGLRLSIGNEAFEDLDEIIARHVSPMAELIRDIVSQKYFMARPKQDVDARLRQEKQDQPRRIPYYVSFARDLPGKLVLSYMPTTRPLHEYVTVTPEGYRFRNTLFRSPSQLIGYLKQHYKDPESLAHAQNKSRGAAGSRTPSQTPGGYPPSAHQQPPQRQTLAQHMAQQQHHGGYGAPPPSRSWPPPPSAGASQGMPPRGPPPMHGPPQYGRPPPSGPPPSQAPWGGYGAPPPQRHGPPPPSHHGHPPQHPPPHGPPHGPPPPHAHPPPGQAPYGGWVPPSAAAPNPAPRARQSRWDSSQMDIDPPGHA